MHLRPPAPIASSPRLRQAVKQVVNAAMEAASADLESEIRAPAVALPAAAAGDCVVEFPVVLA